MANSRTIPVRMPEDLYEEIIASKPSDLKVSTYLLLLLRKGLSAGGAIVSTADSSIQNVDAIVDSALIASLQSRIAGLEEQLPALSNLEATVEASVQKAFDTWTVFADRRVQEAIQQQMGESAA